jgi:hypothetical protein
MDYQLFLKKSRNVVRIAMPSLKLGVAMESNSDRLLYYTRTDDTYLECLRSAVAGTYNHPSAFFHGTDVINRVRAILRQKEVTFREEISRFKVIDKFEMVSKSKNPQWKSNAATRLSTIAYRLGSLQL